MDRYNPLGHYRKSPPNYCSKVKTQRFVSNQPRQQARKTQWQRDKMGTDPNDQANQRDARHTWQRQNPDYWRHYRQRRTDYRERNRLLQTYHDQKRCAKPLAKIDGLGDIIFVNLVTYHLIPGTGPVTCLHRWTRYR